MIKRGSLVKRKDNGQCGVVYKAPKGGILYVIPTSTTGRGRIWQEMTADITTWHESMVYECNSLK